MKNVCEECVKNFYSSGKPEDKVPLKNVALAFTLLQQQLHTADYDNSIIWSRTDAIGAIDMASAAFNDWRAIRTQDETQDYLLQLFLPTLSRQ